MEVLRQADKAGAFIDVIYGLPDISGDEMSGTQNALLSILIFTAMTNAKFYTSYRHSAIELYL
jgi:hypothetical protein